MSLDVSERFRVFYAIAFPEAGDGLPPQIWEESIAYQMYVSGRYTVHTIRYVISYARIMGTVEECPALGSDPEYRILIEACIPMSPQWDKPEYQDRITLVETP